MLSIIIVSIIYILMFIIKVYIYNLYIYYIENRGRTGNAGEENGKIQKLL